MIKSCEDGFIEATDAADYLVKKGVSFREAHNTIGKVVAFCADNNLKLSQVKLEKLKEFSKYFSDDFFKFINIKNCINNKLTDCGTSNKAVKKSLSKAGADILEHEKALDSLNQQIPEFDKIISGYIKTD
jgi:argininosuccinate lyase